MSLSEICIRRPVFAWMLMFGLIIFGLIGFQRMGISQMPDVNFPVVNVALSLPNAAPEVMESDVVDLIEDAVMGIEGLKNVTSIASLGIANVTCEFVLGHEIDVAMQEVENRIDQIRRRLPQKLDPPIVTKTNPEDMPILWVLVTVDETVPLYDQMIYARNALKDQLSSIKGVGDILFAGFLDPSLRVNVDINKLYKYALTSSDILTNIQSEQIENPAGRLEAKFKEYNVRVLGEATSVADFSQIRINTRGGSPNFSPLPLANVASIHEATDDIRALSRFNGKKAVGLGVIKQHGANAVEVARLVRQKIAKITLPQGISLDVKLDSTKFIEESVEELTFTLILSAILTSLVCFFFLGSISSTINVLFAIPTSIVGAFIVLYFFGFTLNTFTMLGLSLAIGIVVDDAIMMLENIVRHKNMGKTRLQAAIAGSNEITFAAIATTLAIAAIFIPVIFMEGVIGRYFYQYGITVTAAVFLSLLEALVLTPMFCSNFMSKASIEEDKGIAKLMNHWMNALCLKYQASIRFILKHRAAVIIASLAFFAGSLKLLNQLPQELIPKQDQSLFLLNIKTPVGTSIWATDTVFRKAETYLKEQADIDSYYTTIGNFEQNDVVNAGSIYVILPPPKERTLSQSKIMDRTLNDLRKLLPNSEIYAQDLSLAGFSASKGYPIEFTITGPDWEKLIEVAKNFRKKIAEENILVDLNTSYQDGMPEVRVTVDRIRAAQKGVSVNTIGNEVATLMGGQVLSAQTQYPKDGHRYDIRVRSLPEQHADPSHVANIKVRNNRGASGDLIALSDVATIEEGTALQLISRLNRQRSVPFFANIHPSHSQKSALESVERLAKETLPKGYRILITGSAQAFLDSFSGIIFALILGIIVAYMVLASQFNSFIHPITVLTALPFSLSGALVALYLANQSLNLFSMIGLILLMGIVKKNSILLVDFTNQKRSEGLDAKSALIEACPLRLRPILMTSVATIFGAVPAALALGPGAETRIPMATSIIGGVLVSTVLTLFVVPCVYSVFTHLESRELEE